MPILASSSRWVLAAFALLAGLVSAPTAAQQVPVEAAQIGQVLDDLHRQAARADADRYFALFAPDAVFIGTDVAERWTIAQFQAYAAPIFASGRGWAYTVRERHVALAPLPCRCVAWFDEVLDSASYGTSRGTGVLVREGGERDGRWKIAQYALTFPIPNDLAADLTQRIRAHESGSAPAVR